MSIVEFLGYVALFIFGFKILRSLFIGVFQTFIAPVVGLGVDWKSLSKWAVVTGATDGIGKAYAEALAKKGFNIVLISRSQDKLTTVAEEIGKKSAVQTKTIVADFSTGFELYESIRSGLEGLEIGVLVNNVGVSYEYPEYYTVIPDGDQLVRNVVNANMISTSMMMRIVLPGMVKRNNGVVLNISSISCLSPLPLLSLYGASKAYMDYLSQAVQEEYSHTKIIIQSVIPSFVVSKLSKLRRANMMAPMPNDYVRWALKTVGIEAQTAGYPTHKLMAYVTTTLNHHAPRFLLKIAFNQTKSLRNGFLKKNKLQDSFSAKNKTQ